MSARLLTAGAIVLAVLALAVVLFGGVRGEYELELNLPNAGQLVKGNQVKVGGVPVGEVTSIDLTPDNRARVRIEIDDDGLSPLHQGTRATLRSTSLSGIANRYISLQPGPNNLPALPDGGRIPADDVRPQVDLDQLLNTLDASTQRDLGRLIRKQATVFAGRGRRDLHAGLEYLNPALSQSSRTTRELLRDQEAFERFLIESASVVSSIASRPDDLSQLTGNALRAVGAVASRSVALDDLLTRLPPTLRKANTTLVNLRPALGELREAVREARPGAPLLAELLERLQPLARDSRPVVRRLANVLDRPRRADDLLAALREAKPLAGEALPLFDVTTKTLAQLQVLLRYLRPYTPDFIGGIVNGFGGTTAGYYDANGHYARIMFETSAYGLTGGSTLVPLPAAQIGLTGYRKGLVRRCPGAGTQPAPDGSNPYLDSPDFPCKREDTPEG